MSEFYKNKDKRRTTREAIIGLGEDSFRKNYYSELQDKLLDLERTVIRNKSIITTMPDILLVSDREGHISPFYIPIKEPKPLFLEIMRNNRIQERLRKSIDEVVVRKELITDNFMLDVEGKEYYLEARLHISEIDEILIIIRDMTDRMLLEMQLREMAERDVLTGLFNRRSFEERILKYDELEFNRLTLVLFDIDGLKVVNDTLGHLEGDNFITRTADILNRILGAEGYVARIGGDEFAVILEGIDEQGIEALLSLVDKQVHESNELFGIIKISLSYGYSHHRSGIVKVQPMFKEADNNMYHSKLLRSESNKNNIVKMLMKALEAKDFITEGHAERMEELAWKIAAELRLAQGQVDRIRLLSKFHDIGKVGIPDSILKKPGRLTPEEWKVMQTHCGIGERIAAESAELKDIADLIFRHHERWDGGGYPLGLKGEEIPIECRILSIVDTFDAMTNDRPYRKAQTVKDAMDEILACSGTQFDPNITRIFIGILDKETMQL